MPAPFWSSTGVSARSQRVSPKAPGRRCGCPFPRSVEDRGSAEGPSGGISVVFFRARSRRRIPMNFLPQSTQATPALTREYPNSVHNSCFANDTILHQRAKKNRLRGRNSAAAGPEPRWIRIGDCTRGALAAHPRRTRGARAASPPCESGERRASVRKSKETGPLRGRGVAVRTTDARVGSRLLSAGGSEIRSSESTAVLLIELSRRGQRPALRRVGVSRPPPNARPHCSLWVRRANQCAQAN